MKIEDIRNNIQAILAEIYGSVKLPATANDQAIESAHFMRAQDAAQIRECCARNQITVSFRAAGIDTIARIKAGHPCKGHTILDKSIKKLENGSWTYDPPEGENETILETCKGLVGSSLVVQDPELGPIEPKGNTGKHILNEIHYLNVTTSGKIVSAHKGKLELDREIENEVLKYCYTGDYNMHDLFVKGMRVVADTIDEHSAIELLNNAMLAKDVARKANTIKFPGKQRLNEVTKKLESRSASSPFSLIRHGAQTSYMDYLLTKRARREFIQKMAALNGLPLLPAEGSIVNIDDKIVVFEPSKNAYILNGIDEVYAYYLQAKSPNPKLKMIDFIPFYYFFPAIKKNYPEYEETISAYETYINKILQKTLNR